MDDEDGPPPWGDEEDGPPPFFEEAAQPKRAPASPADIGSDASAPKSKAKAKKKPIAKGFFDAKPKSKKKGKAKAKAAGGTGTGTEKEPIETLRPKNPTAAGATPLEAKLEGLRLKEVQEAMTSKKKEWMTPDLMQRFSKNPRLMQGFQSPQCQAAIAEFQDDPEGAAKKYKDNKQIMEFMREFMGMMGDHFETMADKQDKDKEKAAKAEAEAQAAAAAATPAVDPEVERQAQAIANDAGVQAILKDPDMQRVLSECQQPGYMNRYMRDPRYGPKLQYLLGMGVFNVQQ